MRQLAYNGYNSVAAAWWAHAAAGLLLQNPQAAAFAQQHQQHQQQHQHQHGPPSPATGCSSPPRCFSPEKAKYEEAPLNLSTKPSDLSSSSMSSSLPRRNSSSPLSSSRKSEIWSPGSVCEREAQEINVNCVDNNNSHQRLIVSSSRKDMVKKRRYSPLTPPSAERTFTVSFFFIFNIYCIR